MKEDLSIELLLRAAFRTLPEPMALLNRAGLLLEANAAFEQAVGTSTRALLRKHIGLFCRRSDEPTEALPLAQEWCGEIVWTAPEQAVVKLHAVITPLQDESGGAGAALLLLSKRIEAAPPAADGSFIQQKKLESLGVLASSVAHDLNNILTGVLGHVSYLRLSLPANLAHRDSIVAIEDGARRAASITQQILEFARGRELELSTANLSLVVAAGLNLLRGSCPKNVRINFRSGKEDIFVYGDEGQLSQLVINLTVNAEEALPEGGMIEVGLERCHLPEQVLEANLDLPATEYAKLSVADDGYGIPAELRERIFEPFFTTKNEHGTGLGLATVFSIVKAHRGAIHVESEEGKGTLFEVYLPLCSGEGYLEKKAETEELPTGSERILVVDDEEAVRTVIQRSLEHLGYEVVIASGGKEALAAFERAKGAFSLVILDMIMPHMSGDELFFKLREIDPKVAVLIASGYSSEGRTRKVLENGALGYIQKPFAVEELAQEVRRCLDLGKASR